MAYIIIVLSLSNTWASHLRFNDKLVTQSFSPGRHSFKVRDTEVRLRITQMSPELARTAATSSIATIVNLYSESATPYPGQVTRTGQCQKDMQPDTFEFKLGDAVVKGIVGGVNDRFAFGACLPGEAKFLGAYFTVYDETQNLLIEARLFQPLRKAKSEELQKLARDLIVTP